jgi:acyl-CoA synthetase (AMP-forming)/AMP-acid ligase II
MPWRDGSFPKGFARENVYPAEVEKVILEHHAVLEVSVIGVPDPKFGEGIKAVCVLKPRGTQCGIMSPSAQELIDLSINSSEKSISTFVFGRERVTRSHRLARQANNHT